MPVGQSLTVAAQFPAARLPGSLGGVSRIVLRPDARGDLSRAFSPSDNVVPRRAGQAPATEFLGVEGPPPDHCR